MSFNTFATIRHDGQYHATFQGQDDREALALAVKRADPFQYERTLSLDEAAARIASIQQALAPAPVKARTAFGRALSALRRESNLAIVGAK